jgi:hypothetical protein
MTAQQSIKEMHLQENYHPETWRQASTDKNGQCPLPGAEGSAVVNSQDPLTGNLWQIAGDKTECRLALGVRNTWGPAFCRFCFQETIAGSHNENLWQILSC